MLHSPACLRPSRVSAGSSTVRARATAMQRNDADTGPSGNRAAGRPDVPDWWGRTQGMTGHGSEKEPSFVNVGRPF